MPSCRDYSLLMSRELDLRLPWWQRFRLRVHLFLCAKCHRFRNQLRFLMEAIELYLTAELEPRALRELKLLPPDARDRIRQALRNESS